MEAITLDIRVVGPAFAAIIAAIGYLWRAWIKDRDDVKKTLQKRADDCDEKHAETSAQLFTFVSDMGEMKGELGRLKGAAETHKSLETLLTDTLDGLADEVAETVVGRVLEKEDG